MEVTCRRASHSIDPRAFNDGNIRFRNGHRAEKWLGDIQGKGGICTNINGSITRRVTLANTRLGCSRIYGAAFYLCESGVNRDNLVGCESWNVVCL